MPDSTHQRIVLAERPTGAPGDNTLRLERAATPTPAQGQLLTRTIYLSLDPYMRGRMSDAPSYAPSVELEEVMTGGTVGQVIDSHAPGFEPGDYVMGFGGWQEMALFKAGDVRKLDPALAPISTALGVLGMPGLTAWSGLHEIGRPKKSETLVVAAASGAVGALVGQIAKLKGCRVVGIAGSQSKCAYLTDELGFDVALNHRGDSLPDELQAACPKGIDIYWENVGGPVFEAVLPLLNPFARMPVCGLIHWYNTTVLPAVPDPTPRLMRSILVNRLTIRGFIVFDFAHLEAAFREEMGSWVRQGRIVYREDIRHGLESAPGAFNELLSGGNFGKMLIQLAEDPSRSES